MVFKRLGGTHDAGLEVEKPDFAGQIGMIGHDRYDPSKYPERTPNFLFGAMVAAWAESNQLIEVDQAMAASLKSRLLEDKFFVDDPEAFEDLARRTSTAPMREHRLRKLIIDSINGLPLSDEPSIFDQIVTARMDRRIHMRPTPELVERIFRMAFGWGPIEPFISDKTVTEIMVVAWDKIFTERTIDNRATLVREAARFESQAVYHRFVQTMVDGLGHTVNFSEPTVDFSLAGGERVNVTIEPISLDRTITIRRKAEKLLTLEKLMGLGAFSEKMHEFMHEANLAGANIITYGATGSGKTTLLSALLHDKVGSARMVIVEDTREITIDPEKHENVVALLTSEHRDMRALVRNAMRMRPDHLIVGETRDATAYDLIQAFNTGQLGSMSTLHASNPNGALVRLTNLVRQEKSAPDEQPTRRMVVDGLHLLIWAARLRGGRRVLFSIDEVGELDEKFAFHPRNIFRVVERPGEDDKPVVTFVPNPDYVMGPELAELFRQQGFDPDKWTGDTARTRGEQPAALEVL